MMKISRTASAALLLSGIAFTSAVHAQWDQGRWYLGAGIGQDHAKLPSLSTTILGVPVNGSGSKTHDATYKAFGGYQFTEHWGVEAGYVRLGDNHTANVTVGPLSGSGNYKLDAWYLVGTGTLPLQYGFSILGKLGVARDHVGGGNLCLGALCGALGGENHTGLLWGVGAEYAITKNWAARLEWEDYGKVSGNDIWGTGNGGALKATAWDLGIKYSF